MPSKEIKIYSSYIHLFPPKKLNSNPSKSPNPQNIYKTEPPNLTSFIKQKPINIKKTQFSNRIIMKANNPKINKSRKKHKTLLINSKKDNKLPKPIKKWLSVEGSASILRNSSNSKRRKNWILKREIFSNKSQEVY